MTKSGYARVVKEWTRGTPLAKAVTVFEVTPDDVSGSGYRDPTPGFVRDFLVRGHAFWDVEIFVRGKKGKLAKIDVPRDASTDVHREWLLITLRSPWTAGGRTYPGGSLLAAKFDEFMAGKRDLTVLFTPGETTSLSGFSWTRHYLLLDVLDNVVDRLEVLTPQAGAWTREPLAGAPALSEAGASGVDPEESDDYLLTVSGFLQPTSLRHGTVGKGEAVPLKQAPAFFDASKEEVHQYFATSIDGTRVPYFVVSPKGIDHADDTGVEHRGAEVHRAVFDVQHVGGRQDVEQPLARPAGKERGGDERVPRHLERAVEVRLAGDAARHRFCQGSHAQGESRGDPSHAEGERARVDPEPDGKSGHDARQRSVLVGREVEPAPDRPKDHARLQAGEDRGDGAGGGVEEPEQDDHRETPVAELDRREKSDAAHENSKHKSAERLRGRHRRR